MTPNWYRGDSGPHLRHRALVSRAPIGFALAEELGGEVEVLKLGFYDREFQRGDEIVWYVDGDKVVRSEYNSATACASPLELAKLPPRSRMRTNHQVLNLSEKSCRNFADGCTCRQMTK
ncbi:hypothetical protein MRB53_025398 [Persea americana]|uniref:Uncharacterized protein n=1 Tax=Persea americana TaxID=3435 RepID=A0ACC2LFB4_PERAE|nr:hypothetical protein MRB53_025398 [Persea americana]